ncbi:MAG: hypothetical protein ACJ8EA_01255 [Xanthobacteraceae bacterium]
MTTTTAARMPITDFNKALTERRSITAHLVTFATRLYGMSGKRAVTMTDARASAMAAAEPIATAKPPEIFD